MNRILRSKLVIARMHTLDKPVPKLAGILIPVFSDVCNYFAIYDFMRTEKRVSIIKC